ncbi:nose resistant to fluoxetine protein 6-like [Adelges cooleyi]|uniref:nose resistant to fluoxetine protein 6-like n=1 Tax=Adelges cooleyi TaxID=133065 RepID=UPI00217F8400|nr:nose resistant to fluoxetine protein 6-like [Adelges cooleyi]
MSEMIRTIAIVLLVFPTLVFPAVVNQNATTFGQESTVRPVDSTIINTVHSRNSSRAYPKVWLANLLYETLVNFTVRDVGNTACRKQTEMYIRHLQNASYWAVKMSDSWPRYLNGLLIGSSVHMGVYDECVSVHSPVQGKYCISQINIQTTSGEDFTAYSKDAYESHDHAWQEILGGVNYDDRVLRNELRTGICIPGSCTATDLQVSLQKELDKMLMAHQIKAQVKVDPMLCSIDKDLYPFDTGYYLTNILIGLLVLICSLSTTYHMIILIKTEEGEKPKKMPELLNMFSFVKNGRDLIKYDRNNHLNIYNGIKVLTMILVLFGHKFLYYVINPILYPAMLEEIYTKGPFFLLTCMNLVDPFFFITGYLMYVMLIPQFSRAKCNWTEVPQVIIYKYLRTLPSYIMVMLLTAFVIPHIGDGPFWAYKMWPEAEKCKNYWWANLLAVSNFIPVENQCLIAGWYISCLLQFLIIGTVVMYIYVKRHKLGTIIIFVLFCTSLIIPFVITYNTKSYGIIKVMVSFLMNPANSFEFKNLYRQFYLRGIPFYAGLLAGLIADALKKREIKMSTKVSYFITAVITIICSYVQMYGKVFYVRHRPYNALEQAIYAVLSHCTWTTILFWIAICHHTFACFGPIEKIFNNRFVVPLGRLSYAVYLVNITVMMIIESEQRAAVVPRISNLHDGWIAGVFKTYVVAILVYLCVEAPFGLLIKKILVGSKSSQDSLKNQKCSQKEPIQIAQNERTKL